MSADAIVVFRPTDPELLKPFLDLDEEDGESAGDDGAGESAGDDDRLYAEALDDGAMLVHTFQPYEVFAEHPAEAREWLAQFGEALPFVHDDPRGFLFFPDTVEPESTTYDALVAEVSGEGFFFVPDGIDGDDELDLEALQALAGQLLGGAEGAPDASGSFAIGQLFTNMQKQIVDALGIEPVGDGKSPIVDDEFETDPDHEPKK